MKFPSIICLLIGGACVLLSQGCATVPKSALTNEQWVDLANSEATEVHKPCDTLNDDIKEQCLHPDQNVDFTSYQN